MWCIQVITPEYRARMYNLLKLYKMEYDPNLPLVCMDEKSKQLLEDTREPIDARPGSVGKYDYEYKRKGTCNIFVAVAPTLGKRVIKVTDTRKKDDFAYFIKELIEDHFPEATCIQLVLDNLNTHFATSLFETFGEEKAKQLLERVKFIYTPKHGSWLNMAEIEINVMDRQCTGGRIATKDDLIFNLGAWTKNRNRNENKILWSFTRKDADKKLSKHYVA